MSYLSLSIWIGNVYLNDWVGGVVWVDWVEKEGGWVEEGVEREGYSLLELEMVVYSLRAVEET